MEKKFFVLIFALIASFISLGQTKGGSGVDYDFKCRCLGVEMDGSTTLESFGKGKNYIDASEQAKKNAVWEVIFYGIKEGNGGCSADPLIFTPGAKDMYEDFFNDFFKDKGSYSNFVSLADEKLQNKVKRNVKKGNEVQQRMVVVRVDRAGLKKHLKTNNIN